MDIDISLDYGLTLLAALLVGTGFVLQQNAAQPEPDSRFLSLRLILDLFHKPRWLLGIGCMVAGQILAAWSIGNLPLAFVEPLLTTNLVFALLVAVPIAKATAQILGDRGRGGALLRGRAAVGIAVGQADRPVVRLVLALARRRRDRVHRVRLRPGRATPARAGRGRC